jgi:hypothetical protein
MNRLTLGNVIIIGILSITTISILIVVLTNHFKKSTPFKHVCNETGLEDYSKVHIPISFMPGKAKCLKRKGTRYDLRYYRNLKEFFITKNNKYCLWDSKYWDEECQNASMEYAYGDYDEDKPEGLEEYKKFKQIIIDFIKYVQANDIEKALTLTDEQAMFFTDDKANCLIQEKEDSNGCRAYFKQKNKHRKAFGEINLELFRENIMQIDTDDLKFYLDDLSHTYLYSIVIPYEYNGTRKYFDIRFNFGVGGGGASYPYDNISYPKIYDLGIHYKLPEANYY